MINPLVTRQSDERNERNIVKLVVHRVLTLYLHHTSRSMWCGFLYGCFNTEYHVELLTKSWLKSNLYCIKGALALFVLVSFSGYVC